MVAVATRTKVLTLPFRRQELAVQGGYRVWVPGEERVEWEAEKTALVLCDVWDRHTCRGAEERLAKFMGREAAYSGAGVEWDSILNSKFTYGPPLVYEDSSKMEFGAFRTLQPPMPSRHDIFKEPPMLPVAQA